MAAIKHSHFSDTPLTHPWWLDGGIHAANGHCRESA